MFKKIIAFTFQSLHTERKPFLKKRFLHINLFRNDVIKNTFQLMSNFGWSTHFSSVSDSKNYIVDCAMHLLKIVDGN